MVKAPTPEEEDRRRLCRERSVLIGERVQHVNRVKGLLFSQGISSRCAATGGSGWIRSRPAMVAYCRIT